MSETPDIDMSRDSGNDAGKENDQALLVNGTPINQLPGRMLDSLAAELLAARGFNAASGEVQSRLGGLVSAVQAQVPMTPEDFIQRHTPIIGQPGSNALDKSDAPSRIASSLAQAGIKLPASAKDSLEVLKDGSATRLLTDDPLHRQEAFRDLQAWVEGSLDMYRVRIPTFLCVLWSC